MKKMIPMIIIHKVVSRIIFVQPFLEKKKVIRISNKISDTEAELINKYARLKILFKK